MIVGSSSGSIEVLGLKYSVTLVGDGGGEDIQASMDAGSLNIALDVAGGGVAELAEVVERERADEGLGPGDPDPVTGENREEAMEVVGLCVWGEMLRLGNALGFRLLSFDLESISSRFLFTLLSRSSACRGDAGPVTPPVLPVNDLA